jgi:hypothetical protein
VKEGGKTKTGRAGSGNMRARTARQGPNDTAQEMTCISRTLSFTDKDEVSLRGRPALNPSHTATSSGPGNSTNSDRKCIRNSCEHREQCLKPASTWWPEDRRCNIFLDLRAYDEGMSSGRVSSVIHSWNMSLFAMMERRLGSKVEPCKMHRSFLAWQ